MQASVATKTKVPLTKFSSAKIVHWNFTFIGMNWGPPWITYVFTTKPPRHWSRLHLLCSPLLKFKYSLWYPCTNTFLNVAHKVQLIWLSRYMIFGWCMIAWTAFSSTTCSAVLTLLTQRWVQPVRSGVLAMQGTVNTIWEGIFVFSLWIKWVLNLFFSTYSGRHFGTQRTSINQVSLHLSWR